MIFEQLPAFIIACTALVASPGPATLTIAATSAAFGWKAALPVMCGLMTGMVAIMLLVGLGVATLIFSHPLSATIASVLAALYMLYLAWRIATAPVSGQPEPDAEPPGFGPGLALNFVNPKAYAAVGAVFSAFVLIPEAPLADAGTKALLMFLLILTGNICWLATGRALAHFVHEPRTRRIINFVFAGALLLSLVAAFLI